MAAAMRGASIDDQKPPIIHVAEYKSSPGSEGHGYWAALCDGGTVTSIPGHFDPGAGNACRECAALILGAKPSGG